MLIIDSFSCAVASHAPEKIFKVAIDPRTGLTDADAEMTARKIGVPDASLAEAKEILKVARRLAEEGLIQLGGGGGDDAFV